MQEVLELVLQILLDKLEEVLKNTQDPIIQEYVGDDNTEYTCGVISLDGGVKNIDCFKQNLEGRKYTSFFIQQRYPGYSEAILKGYK